MIEYKYNADIFRSKAEALVNPVNCLGILGKGLAKQFNQHFPDECRRYMAWCQSGEARIGAVLAAPTAIERPRWIIHFPTKDDWRHKSQLNYIARGLVDLVDCVGKFAIDSVAVPALGCGEGGLPWSAVKALIMSHLESAANDTRWEVYPPHD